MVARLYSVSPWGNLTGAPICALEHLRVLKGSFDEVGLVLCQHGPLEDRAREAGVPTWCFPFAFRGLRHAGAGKFLRNIGEVVRSRWAYVRGLHRLLKEKPGILHIHSRAAHLPYALLAGWWARVPVVVTIHEPWTGGGEAWSELWMIRRLADHVVFLSQEMARQHPGFLRRKGSVAYNHVEVENLPPAPRLRALPRVVMPAVMCHRKGFDVFLEVCRRLREAGLGFEAWMVGGWDLDSDRRQAMEFLGLHRLESTVVDQGRLSDMAPVYAQMDVLLLTSRRDPLPRVVMEAMAHGVPVVATRVDGIPEMVEDGVTGFLVESEDAEGFAQAVGRLLRDGELRSRMGASGRERARSLFSPETYAEAMGRIYAGLVPDAEKGRRA